MSRFALVMLAAVLFLPLVIGCEGSSRHVIDTDGYGTLAGLEITPEPQSLGIGTDKVFYLDWRSGYDPPEEFTVSLRAVYEDGSTEPIYTSFQDLDPYNPGHYRLEPSWYLPTGTFLLLSVVSPDERVRAMYLTEASTLYDTKTQRNENGKEEHTIVLKKQ